MIRELVAKLYQYFIKPVLFLFPADLVHEGFLKVGRVLGKFSSTRGVVGLFAYSDTGLEQNYFNINFPNPIGLAAGFDYNGDLVNILPAVGFGFHTVGTVTNEPYEGNARPMLGRLPKSQSLLVNKGFKNNGVDEVLQSLPEGERFTPYGISIGSTNKKYGSFIEIINDIEGGFIKANTHEGFQYFELNISCPNLVNLENIAERVDTPAGLKMVLDKLAKLNLNRPVFLKMPLEKSLEDIDALVSVASQYSFVKALIFANLVKDRSNKFLNKNEVANIGKGNFSGKPTFERSNELIAHAYRNYSDRFVIIGCGGVFTPEDAYLKIKLGASLIQMITGMIYLGPTQIAIINKGLAESLRKDGYKNISEAVGALSGKSESRL
jgi:dihydroorotate dehydrogenase subfamily 2